MDVNKRIDKTFRTRKLYILMVLIVTMCTTAFSKLSSAADENSVGLVLPRIEGVEFYVGGSLIDTSFTSNKIDIPKGSTTNLEVKIDNDMYYSGENDSEKVKFSVTGNLSATQPEFREGSWYISITPTGDDTGNNALNLSLKDRGNMYLDFSNPDGITFRPSDNDPNHSLNGQICSVKAGKSFDFWAEVDENKINMIDKTTFQVSAGNNECKFFDNPYIGGDKEHPYIEDVEHKIIKYHFIIDEVQSDAKVNIDNLIEIKFPNMQGIAYEDASGKNLNGTSRMFSFNSSFVFNVKIADNVTLPANGAIFNVGRNTVSQEQTGEKGGRDYQITIDNLQFSAEAGSDSFVSFRFPEEQGISYYVGEDPNNEGNKIAANGYHTAGLGSPATFKAKISDPLSGKGDLEFTAQNNGVVNTTVSGDTAIIEIENVKESADITLESYKVLKIDKSEYISGYYSDDSLTEEHKFKNDDPVFTKGMAVKGTTKFYVKLDSDKIKIDNDCKIKVTAGDNNVEVTRLNTKDVHAFEISIRTLQSATVEFSGVSTVNFPSGNVENLKVYESDPSTLMPITTEDMKGPVPFATGTTYKVVAQIPRDAIGEFSVVTDTQDPAANVTFYTGDDEATVEKYSEIDGIVNYSLTLHVNTSGDVDFHVKGGYTITFGELPEGVRYNNRNANTYAIYRNYDKDYTFGIDVDADAVAGTKFLINGKKSEDVKVSGSTVSISHISEDITVSAESVKITIPNIDGVSFYGYYKDKDGKEKEKAYNPGDVVEAVPGHTKKFNAKYKKADSGISTDEAGNVEFSAGGNAVTTTLLSEGDAQYYNYDVDVTFSEDSEISLGKIISFPDIYNINFYEYNNGALGSQINNGSRRSVIASKQLQFIIEVDNSIKLEKKDDKIVGFYAESNKDYVSLTEITSITGGKEGKTYLLMDISKVFNDGDITSDWVTLNLPVVKDVYYYKDRDSKSGEYSNPIKDNKITLNKNLKDKYEFYIRFMYGGAQDASYNVTSGAHIDFIKSANDYTTAQVTSISESASVTIDLKNMPQLNVIMPESSDVLKSLSYSTNGGESYDKNENGTNMAVSVNYGQPIKLKFSFKSDVEGYSNLYGTLQENIKVKAYSAKGVESGADVREGGTILQILNIRNTVDDSKKFIVPDDVYETDIYYPTEDTILVISGVKEDVYDISLISGDNDFIDKSTTGIDNVLNIFKVISEGNEVEIPYSPYESAYIIKSVPYGEKLKFRYEFTNGATDEGIKYNLSTVKFIENSKELTVTEKTCTTTVNSDTFIEISGITPNKYDIAVPKVDAIVQYVINRGTPAADSPLWQTAENGGKITLVHGQTLALKITSTGNNKFIKEVMATDVSGSDSIVLYSAAAKEKEVIETIEKVTASMNLDILLSDLEIDVQFVLEETKEDGSTVQVFPDNDKIKIYQAQMHNLINVKKDGDKNYASVGTTNTEQLSFTLSPDYKYNKSTLLVSFVYLNNDTDKTGIQIPEANNKYTLPLVDSDVKVIIRGLELNKYRITFPTYLEKNLSFYRVVKNEWGQDEVIRSPLIGEQPSVPHGSTFMFISEITEGYTLSGDSVKANGESLRLTNGKYVLNDISSDIDITVSDLTEMEYTLLFPNTISGVRFTDGFGSSISSVKKKYMESYSFKIAVDSEYSKSEDNMLVYAVPAGSDWSAPDFDPTIESVGAIRLKKDAAANYTLDNISRDSVIYATGIKINEYLVDLPIGQEGIKFKVQVKDKYGEKVDVELTEKNREELAKVSHGDNFIFSVEAEEGYDVSQMDVKATFQVSGYTTEIDVEKISSGYILQNVTADMTVKVSNIGRVQHTITLNGENMVFRTQPNAAETIRTGQINHDDGEFKFYISPADNYKFSQSGISITTEPIGGARVNINQDEHSVVVSEVTQDVTLSISGVELRTVTITLPKTEGISFMSVEDETSYEATFELDEKNVIAAGSKFKFHIKADPGYDISNILVSTGPGVNIYPSEGIYTITDTMQDVTVTVSNIQYAVYTVKLRGENMTFYEPNGLFPQSDFTVAYLGSMQFRITANTGYEIDLENGIVFSVKNKQITPGDESSTGVRISKPDKNGVFTVSNVKEDTVINVSGAGKRFYNLNFPTDLVGAKLQKPDGTPIGATEQAEYLSDFSFEVVADTGYNTHAVTVEIDPAESGIVAEVDGGFTIQSVTGDANISIKGIEPNEYMVIYKGEGIDFYKTDGSQVTSSSVKFGESFEFSIKAQSGYNLLRGYKVYIMDDEGNKAFVSLATQSASLPGGTKIEEDGRFTYTVSNVQGNMTILSDSVGKSEYAISLPTSVAGIEFVNEDGQTITSGSMLHGGNFSFKIRAKEGYDISDISVTANQKPIDLVDGKYTIENVTEDIDVNVTGVKATKVYINLKYVAGVTFKDTDDNELSTLKKIEVDNGSDYSFKVSLDESYTQSKDKMTVSLSPETSQLLFERGIYTIKNITQDTDVIVSNVELNTYKINLTEVTGVTYKDAYGTSEIKGEQTVSYGQEFKFMLSPNEGYNLSDVSVSIKGKDGDRTVINPVDGVYSIPNINMDYTVVVENAQRGVCNVEIRSSDGVAVMDTGGNAMESKQSVKYGDSFSFRLSIDTAYDKSVPLVTVKGRSQPISPENNVYTVENITGDTIVEISNVKKNTYKVTFKPTEGVIYRTEKNKDFSGYLEVEYGGTLNFKVALKDEYDASQIMVLLDGNNVLSANGGVYQIVSVGSDCEVSVKYSEKNVEESVIEMIAALPDKVTTAEDAAKVVSVSRAYNNLPEDRQKLVTNLDKLKILQTQTSEIHHESNDVRVSGLDWQIKVNVVPLDGDAESAKRLNEKMERKTVIEHYEISLINSLTGEKYEPQENQKVGVVLPLEVPKGYINTVIVHEKESGSIEYLDVLISNGYAKFETSSFSIFAAAGKKVENYVEEANNVTVSLAGLTDNEEETKKQILGQELSAIVDDDSGISNSTSGTKTNPITGNTVDTTSGGSLWDKMLAWILNNEFLITAIIIALFAIWIFIILHRGEKNKDT